MTAAIIALLVGLLLLGIGVPIAYLLVVTLGGFLIATGQGADLVILNQQFSRTLNSFTLLSVPLFLLAGFLMEQSGMAERLARFALSLMGRTRGGLAHAGVVANIGMSGVSGSATADTAAMGAVFMPMMKREGYTPGFSAAIISSAGMIGPIIPPSILMIIYAGMADLSTGRLLLAGVVPGLAMGLFLMGTIVVLARRRDMPKGTRSTRSEILTASKDAVHGILMPLIILGGLFGGLYTPTEGAAIAVAYALVVGVVIYRTLTVQRIMQACRDTVVANGIVMFVVAATAAVSYLLNLRGATRHIVDGIESLGDSPVLLWACTLAILFVLGILLEGLALMVLVIPIFVPTLVVAGTDPLVVGIVLILTCMLGAITPPVGVSMFLVCKIAGCTMWEFTREIWPMLVTFLLFILLLLLVPGIVTFLPNAVMP